MIPLVGAPPTIAAGMKKYREVFCRDEGFDHVSRWIWCNFSIEGRLSLFQLLPTQKALLPIPAGSWPLDL